MRPELKKRLIISPTWRDAADGPPAPTARKLTQCRSDLSTLNGVPQEEGARHTRSGLSPRRLTAGPAGDSHTRLFGASLAIR
jgi:hypothetical protein